MIMILGYPWERGLFRRYYPFLYHLLCTHVRDKSNTQLNTYLLVQRFSRFVFSLFQICGRLNNEEVMKSKTKAFSKVKKKKSVEISVSVLTSRTEMFLLPSCSSFSPH